MCCSDLANEARSVSDEAQEGGAFDCAFSLPFLFLHIVLLFFFLCPVSYGFRLCLLNVFCCCFRTLLT